MNVNQATRETRYVPNSIESRIQNAVKWNTANPTKKITVHLRFHVGETAPEEWKNLCGRVEMTDPQFGVKAVVARWWVKDGAGNYIYRDLYQRAMEALAPAVAAINDNASTKNLIGTVNAPGAAPNYPEPMLLYASSDDVRRNLMLGGFNAEEHNKFMLWFPSAAKPFNKVGVELAVNPYQNIDARGNFSGANATMYKEVAQSLIDSVGAGRTVIANYSARELDTKGKRGGYKQMYDWMSDMTKGANPVWAGVQMARPHHVAEGNSDVNEQWDDVARWAASKGFHFAETTGPNAKKKTKPAPHGKANYWPEAYHDDSNDIEDMESINAKFATNPRPTTSDAPSDDPGGSTDSTKPHITGFLDRKGVPKSDFQKYEGKPLVKNFVVEANWNKIEEKKGVYDFSSIEGKIRSAEASGAQVRLRIFSGRLAPSWLKSEVGTVTWKETEDTEKGTYQLPKFWTTAYQEHYKKFLTALSDKYDSNPRVSEVTLAMCMTTYSEPMIRQQSSGENKAKALAAGYTYTADFNCLKSDINFFDNRDRVATAGKLFGNTRVTFAVNPFQGFNPPAGRNNMSDTMEIMQYCRDVLGSRCVLGNNSIRYPAVGGNYAKIYEKQKALGKPLYYQTATPSKINDWRRTIQWSINQGATSVELNSGYGSYDKATLASFSDKLAANQRRR